MLDWAQREGMPGCSMAPEEPASGVAALGCPVSSDQESKSSTMKRGKMGKPRVSGRKGLPTLPCRRMHSEGPRIQPGSGPGAFGVGLPS